MIDIGDCFITCDECPLGRDAILDRYYRLKDYDDGDWQPEYCACDKNGGYRFYIGGYCDDAFCSKPPSNTSYNSRKTGRAYRRVMREQKTNRLMRIVNRYYIPHAGYVDWDFVDGKYVQVGKYIKYPKNSNCQRWMKKYTNKIVRHSHIPLRGNGYRKTFDYWWEMY
ncbi:MAG: hypothetical protein PHR82_09165 [Endomicrobiaceae bacterium]|nr:hypothetical protein [Endomicrobiaceae bacterium]